jgi:hypothetical protein
MKKILSLLTISMLLTLGIVMAGPVEQISLTSLLQEVHTLN